MTTNTTLEVLRAAWNFIENVTDDDPERTDKFFKLRAQVREAFSLAGRNFNGEATKPLERTADEPTNEERADRIDTVMQAYCLTLEGRDFDGDEDDVKDMLTDLMHFCLRMEINFEENLRVARNNYEHERNAENGTPNTIGCPVCGCFLEVSRTDTLLGIDREIFGCQNCDETFIRELTVADSPIERAVKCIGCGSMIPQSSARIFYQRDDFAHFIGECCWDERLSV